MSKDKAKMTAQSFIRFCNVMGLNLSPLGTSSDYYTKWETSPKQFSLDGLQSLQDVVESPPQHELCSSLEECKKVIQGWISRCENRVICTANFQVMMEVHRNENFTKELLETIDLMTTQSITVRLILNHIGVHLPGRIETGQLFWELCQYCCCTHKKVFLLGDKLDIVQKVKSKLANDFDSMEVVGSAYISLEDGICVDDEIVQKINESGANLVFVSLPHPQQEMWLSKHRHFINSVLFGVGKTFPCYVGPEPQVLPILQRPEFIQLYHLMKMPHEMYKHYLPNLPAFIWLILKTQISRFPRNCTFRVSGGRSRVRTFLSHLYVCQ